MSANRLRAEFLRSATVLGLCTAFVLLVHPAYFPKPTAAAEPMPDRGDTRDFRCVSYCSPTRPGVGLMEVKARLATSHLDDAALRLRARQQGLEVTVYSEGFERGLYASLPSLTPKSPFRSQTSRRIPGLAELRVADVATRLDESAQSFLLMEPRMVTAYEGEWLLLRLEGLTPGLEYSYRVSGERAVVTCQAVVCPVDEVPVKAARKTKSKSIR